jgi:TonB family protein
MNKLIFSSLIAVLVIGLCPKDSLAQDDNVYSFVAMKNPPTYPGGMADFYKFISNTIQYPKSAKDENIQGTVYISFVVEKDGSLADIKVDRKLGSGTDEEAIRVLKLSKRWNPGLLDGNPVKVKYNIPVRFSIPGVQPRAKTSVYAPSKQTAPADGSDNAVYSYVSMETPPTYPGGMAQFYKFLGDNIQYPAIAKENKISGTVYLSFTIEKDGTINDVKVDRKLGFGTDEEAVRVVKLSQKWIPGVQNGKPVNVKYNIPVKFSLPK